MEATQLLSQDHRMIDQLFKQFEGLQESNFDDKRRVANEIIRQLSIHASIEEMYFYPTLREKIPQSKKGELIADKCLDDHQNVKNLLQKIMDMSEKDQSFNSLIQQVKQEVVQHVDKEEKEIFPMVKEFCSQQELYDLGEKLQNAKKTAPTHPHPMAPNKPPMNIVGGTAMGATDRLQDQFRKFPEEGTQESQESKQTSQG